MKARSFLPRLESTIVFTATAFAAVFFVLSALHARNLDWNAARLVPSEAIVYGKSIYAAPDAGVLLGEIYMPLSAIAYAPVVWISDVSQKLVAGSALALLYFFLPFALLVCEAASFGRVRRQAALALFLATALFVGFDVSLRYAAVMIHAEAPAAGLGCLAVFLAAAPPNARLRIAFAGTVAVAACLAKQTWIGAFPALLAALWFRHGRNAAGIFLIGGGVAVATFAIGVSHFSSWPNLIFNTLTVPGGHPWSTAGWHFIFGEVATHQTWTDRLQALTKSFLSVAPRMWPSGTAVATAILLSRQKPGENFAAEEDRVAVFAGWVALAQAPVSLAGFVKVGGDVNTLAPFLAPALMCTLALGLRIFRGPFPSQPHYAALSATLVVLMLCNLPRFIFLAESISRTTESYRTMVEYQRAHPGTVYLPWNPLLTWTAERRLDHFESGIFERVLADRAPKTQHIFAHLPPTLRYVAVRHSQPPSCREMYFQYLPGSQPVASPPGLEDWVFYAVRLP